MWHRRNLAAKESGLQCTSVNNDNFTVLVSGGSRHVHCVAVTFKMTEQVQQWICIKFCVKFERSSAETVWMIQKAAAMGSWWFAAASRQCACSCIMSCAEFYGETSNHPGDSALLQPRFGTLWLLAFPKTKITFEREEISEEHQWDSGKYDGAADGDWENCVRSQGAYFEGDWGVMSYRIKNLVFFPINVYFSYSHVFLSCIC